MVSGATPWARYVQQMSKNGAPKVGVPSEAPSEAPTNAFLTPLEPPRALQGTQDKQKFVKNASVGASLGASLGTPTLGALF